MPDPHTLIEPLLAPPAPGAVDIWWFSLEEGNHAWTVLSAEERAIASARAAPHGKRYAASHAALRSILSRYTGQCPADITFHLGPHGKPSLVPFPHIPDIRFNLSHSDALLCCAITTGREVGVDIERLRPIPEADAIAEIMFTQQERDVARAYGEEWFLRAWVRKEAVLKAMGIGIVENGDADTDMTDGWTVRDLDAAAGYVAAVAVEGDSVSELALSYRTSRFQLGDAHCINYRK